jgi:hypothetical protein
MPTFVKKPIQITAHQWTGKTLDDANEFAISTGFPKFSIGGMNGLAGLIIPTLEGDHLAEHGDWIIRGVKGEYYPCKPDIFVMTYDLVTP